LITWPKGRAPSPRGPSCYALGWSSANPSQALNLGEWPPGHGRRSWSPTTARVAAIDRHWRGGL